VCGVEAHVCVLQTVLDLVGAGWTVFHATDAISAGQPDQVAPAFRRMERAGALPSGTLGAMYELVSDAADPRFRDILALAKQVGKES
jgi:nicotinamidase-related amidase